MGTSCQGLKKTKSRKVASGMFPSSGKPPGLKFLSRLANEPPKTPRRKLRLRRIKCFSPKSDIFNWNGKNPSPAIKSDRGNCSKSDPQTCSKSDPSLIKPQHVRKPPVKPNLRWLQMLLINAGTKKRHKTGQNKSSRLPAKSSMDRRLTVSEKPCERKSHCKDSTSVFKLKEERKPHPHFGF